MSKKNQFKKLFDRAEIESADAHPHSPEPVQDEQPADEAAPVPSAPEEAAASGAEMDSAPEGSLQPAETAADMQEPVPAESGPETHLLESQAGEESTEDILEDVRRSLIEEEETAQSEKQSRWWRRIARRGKKDGSEETPPPVEEIDLPIAEDLTHIVETSEAQEKPKPEIDEIEDLIHLLEAEDSQTPAEPSLVPEVETAAEPEPTPEIDFEELKKQAFQTRADQETEEETLSDVRTIALEGGEEVLVEVDTRPVDPMEERVQAFENALKPYRRYINSALALLGVGMAVVAALILFNVYQQSRPQPVVEPSDVPYPTSVSLPGGWSFPLGRGALQDGRWDPRGAEWLEGTEVCRWVALPWSTQLEAVIRTLNRRDPIDLFMSNNDKLVYQVDSIRQLTPEQMQELDTNSPCLLLILTQTDTEERWVLTALP